MFTLRPARLLRFRAVLPRAGATPPEPVPVSGPVDRRSPLGSTTQRGDPVSRFPPGLPEPMELDDVPVCSGSRVDLPQDLVLEQSDFQQRLGIRFLSQDRRFGARDLTDGEA